MENQPPKEENAESETVEKAAGPESRGRRRRRSPRRKKVPSRETAAAPSAPVEKAPEDNWDVACFKVPPAEGKTRFHDLNLPAALMHAICDLGFRYCTPIQAAIIPDSLAGRDATGRAQTGTGKTAAFLITVITRILLNPDSEEREPGTPRVLILAPTRELVLQISAEARDLSKYCNVNIVSIFGGMDYQKQRKQLSAGPVDIVVATPGRLIDFQERRDMSLKKIEVLIIDEADRMLDMGFIPDVRRIINSTPPKTKRQTLLFSATLTAEIARIASQWTRQPVTVEIEPEQVAVESVDQIVYNVTTGEKFALLFNIIDRQHLDRVLVFCNRRDEVQRLSEKLARYGINCAELSGEVPQKVRIQRLNEFKSGKIRVLVATDVAGRGLHIEGMDHVINFTLPRDPEDYVHRIGRTGRAGAVGTSVSFADEQDAFYLPPIESFIGRGLSCIQPMEDWLVLPEPVLPEKRSGLHRGRKKPSAFQGESPLESPRKKRRPRRRKA